MEVNQSTPSPKEEGANFGKNKPPSTPLLNERVLYVDLGVRTPIYKTGFVDELKDTLNSRNMLTCKTKKIVCESLSQIAERAENLRNNYKREFAMREIRDSEEVYMKYLDIIIKYFMEPTMKKNLLNLDDYETLFGNINDIYNLNKMLLQELKNDTDNTARAFARISPFMKIYSVYATNFKKSINFLLKVKALHPAFAKFMADQESRPEVQNKLSAMLVMPIQRVPRYKMLLSNLYDLTPPHNKDYELLKESVRKIEEAANHINKLVEEHENAQKLLEIQRTFYSSKINFVTPGRRLIKEGDLYRMPEKPDEQSIKTYVILLDDIIVFCKVKKDCPSSGWRKPKTIVPLNKCKIVQMLDKGCFKITYEENNEAVFYDKHLEQTVNWTRIIDQTIDNYLESRKSLLKTDSLRHAVKRKNLGVYHEVGLSPGRPMKRKRLARNSVEENAMGPLETTVSSVIAGAQSNRLFFPQSSTPNCAEKQVALSPGNNSVNRWQNPIEQRDEAPKEGEKETSFVSSFFTSIIKSRINPLKLLFGSKK